jgi:cytochrome c biogenesis protein ResB
MADSPTIDRLARLDADPLRLLWRLLTSVRFALALIGFLAFVSLLGVLIPQVPAEIRDSPAAVELWLQGQRETFGALTEVMWRLDLFNVFSSLWFLTGVGLLVASVCVCTANRLPPVWRNVTRPQARVPDPYLEGGAGSFSMAAPAAGAIAAELGRRRYKVRLEEAGGATYLFADRFPWAQLATFVSHLALLLFLAGGLITLLRAESENVFVAEGRSAPVFGLSAANQMQVYVEDAVGRFDASGFPLDYRTRLVVYHDGVEVARGVSTVNSPLRYGGYRFHQAAYFENGAALQVREAGTGRLLYDDVLALDDVTPAAHVVLRDASGAVLLNDTIVPTDFLPGASGGLVTLPDGRQLWIGLIGGPRDTAWRLLAFPPGATPDSSRTVAEGDTLQVEGLTITFAASAGLPSTLARGLPAGEQGAVALLSQGPSGRLLTLTPVDGQAIVVAEGERVVVGGREYAFLGRREFAGLTVRRDPGSLFIWVATALLLLGLTLTFYLPRRRLWGKIESGLAHFRGLGGRSAAIEREVREAVAAAARRQEGTGG